VENYSIELIVGESLDEVTAWAGAGIVAFHYVTDV
jgi:hypothetical protein